MNSPEKDNRLVDYLCDELSPKERQAYAEHLEGHPDEAKNAEALAATLRLYRQHEPQGPSQALSERIMEEAARAQRPFLARLFGSLLPGVGLRPAVGIAAMAVLVVGVGVFALLADHGDTPDRSSRSRPAISSAASQEKPGASPKSSSKTLAAADSELPESDQASTGGALASRLKGKSSEELNDDAPASRPKGQAWAAGSGGRGRAGLDGLRKGKGEDKDSARDRRPSERVGGAKGRRARKSAYYAVPPAKSPALAAPQPAPRAGNKTQNARELLAAKQANALHNQANVQLNRGKLHTACRTYQSLAKRYQSYNRRADVLLEWARCELARGYFKRAQGLLQQVMKSYPKQRKAAQILLAQVRTRWSQSKLASQRYRRAVRRKARARPARRTRRAAPAQATESGKGDAL